MQGPGEGFARRRAPQQPRACSRAGLRGGSLTPRFCSSGIGGLGGVGGSREQGGPEREQREEGRESAR